MIKFYDNSYLFVALNGLLKLAETDEELVIALCSLIDSLVANDSKIQNMLRKGQVIPNIMKLLELWKNNNLCIASIINVITTLCRDNVRIQNDVYSPENVPLFVAWLTSTSPELQFSVTTLIGALVPKSKKRRTTFEKSGVVPALKALTKSENELVKTAAHSCLGAFS